MRLAGDLMDEVDERGRRIEGDTILVLFNAHHESLPFALPSTLAGQRWERLLDTAQPTQLDTDVPQPYLLHERSLAVFRTRQLIEPPPGERASVDLGVRPALLWRRRNT
jgi:isoamylase